MSWLKEVNVSRIKSRTSVGKLRGPFDLQIIKLKKKHPRGDTSIYKYLLTMNTVPAGRTSLSVADGGRGPGHVGGGDCVGERQDVAVGRFGPLAGGDGGLRRADVVRYPENKR